MTRYARSKVSQRTPDPRACRSEAAALLVTLSGAAVRQRQLMAGRLSSQPRREAALRRQSLSGQGQLSATMGNSLWCGTARRPRGAKGAVGTWPAHRPFAAEGRRLRVPRPPRHNRGMDIDPQQLIESPNDGAASGRKVALLNTFVAITVALLATFMGVCKVKDDNIVQAMQQAQADKLDHWNFYQARNVRQDVAEATATQLRLAKVGRPATEAAAYDEAIARYDAKAASEGGAQGPGRAGPENIRQPQLPRRPVRPVRRGAGDRHRAARRGCVDQDLVDVLAVVGAHQLRCADGPVRLARLGAASGHLDPAAVLAGVLSPYRRRFRVHRRLGRCGRTGHWLHRWCRPRRTACRSAG